MVVTISHHGYIKRTPSSTYRAQRRGGKGLNGAKTEEEDPIEHLFVASTHDYLLFFTNRGKVYWQKVYDLPQLGRESRGRAIVNLLNLAEGEKDRRLPRHPRLRRAGALPDHGHPQGPGEEDGAGELQPAEEGRHHRHQAREGDELIDVAVVEHGRRGRAGHRPTAWRFASARPTPGRWAATPAASRASSCGKDDGVVGMVVADPDGHAAHRLRERLRQADAVRPQRRCRRGEPRPTRRREMPTTMPRAGAPRPKPTAKPTRRRTPAVGRRYRTQRRGGKGLRDIKTTDRNGPVVGIARVDDDDELLDDDRPRQDPADSPPPTSASSAATRKACGS